MVGEMFRGNTTGTKFTFSFHIKKVKCACVRHRCDFFQPEQKNVGVSVGICRRHMKSKEKSGSYASVHRAFE